MRKIMQAHAFALSYDYVILTSADNILYWLWLAQNSASWV